MKKGLKIFLIIMGILIAIGGARAGLTKGGIIPNRLGVEVLGPINCVDCKGNGFWQGMLEEPQKKGQPCCKGTYHYYEYEGSEDKPIIYLYPTEETKVNVILGRSENLSYTYPKYNLEKGRNVIAQPNGDLLDLDTNRKLYALYREGKTYNKDNFDEGFVVAGKDIIPFLEEKLEILGLNEREAEEFIIYWLPQMEGNEWNLIRFETIEEQNNNMPLIIIPTPDTLIRVMMDWKAIDEPIKISEQELTTPERIGFTIVERGGSPRN